MPLTANFMLLLLWINLHSNQSFFIPIPNGIIINGISPSQKIPSLGNFLKRRKTSIKSSNGQEEEWKNFNPFEKQSKQEQKIKSSILISPRKQRMDDIVMDLYRCNHDNTLMDDILRKNKDFLLEPFNNEDFDSELESASIYDIDMSRDDKINKYKSVMMERIDNAKNGEVKIVLRTMMEFILEETSA